MFYVLAISGTTYFYHKSFQENVHQKRTNAKPEILESSVANTITSVLHHTATRFAAMISTIQAVRTLHSQYIKKEEKKKEHALLLNPMMYFVYLLQILWYDTSIVYLLQCNC
jgi:hypothetical protein